jgi:polyisoprenoid-binding protein YceI
MSTITSPSIIPAGTWLVDLAHSKVGFAVKHLGIATVRGEFTDFEGTLEIGGVSSSARASGTVKAASVETNQPQRDAHLRSPNFLDADHYPELGFESTSVAALTPEELWITGRLTIRGVTNDIVLHAEAQATDIDPSGNERIALQVTGELSRSDYGVKSNQALGSLNLVVSDKVKLTLAISAVKQSS